MRSAAPEVHPVLAHIERALPDCVSHVLLDKLRAIALDKVKSPALKADSVFEPVEPVDERSPQALVQMVQICTRASTSALPLCMPLLCARSLMPRSQGAFGKDTRAVKGLLPSEVHQPFAHVALCRMAHSQAAMSCAI